MKEFHFHQNLKSLSCFFLVAAFLFLFSAELFTQTNPVRHFLPDPDLFFEEVSIKDTDFSLVNISVIAQSSDGYIWLGTQNRLLLYNGYNFEVIEQNIINKRTYCFFENGNKDWWVGTQSGLYIIRNKKIIPHPEFNHLNNLSIFSILKASDGAIWFGTSAGIYKFKNNYLEKFSLVPDIYVRVIKQDRRGVIWAGTPGSGIFLLRDDKVIRRYLVRNGLPNQSINQIIIGDNDDVWAATRRGLLRFTNYEFTYYNQNNGLTNPAINDIIKDRKSNIWLATEGGVFLLANNKFRRFSYNEGLSNDLTYCIFEDREANIFVGAHSNALNKLKKSRLKIYNTRNGLSSSWIWSVMQDRHGDIWIGTNGNGADKISNGKVINYTEKDGLPANHIRTISEDKNGDIWFGTNLNGIARLKNGKFTTYNKINGLTGDAIRVIYPDKKGNLWIGTNLGLTKYDYEKFTNYYKSDGLVNEVIRCITEDKDGKLLIGTSKGMSIFSSGKFTNYNVKDGLSDSLIFSIEVDSSNTYWIGTYTNGFNRMKNGKIFRYTLSDGLINEIVYRIFIVNNYELVVSCNTGIYSMKLKDLNDYADGKIKGPLRSIVYEKESGSSTLECNGGNQPSGWYLKNGEIWVSTLSGVAALHPHRTEINEVAPNTVIDKIIIDNSSIHFDKSIEVSPGTDLIKIEFSSLSFTNPKKNKYKYKVEGLDNNWIDVGTQNIAYLSNLPYGTYYFKVISCNNDGLWNLNPAVVELNIRPFFYQTKGFYFFTVLILAGFIYVGYKIRIDNMKKREQALVNLVAERTKNLLESEKLVKSLIDSKEKFFSIITHDMKNLFTALLFYSKELYQNFSHLTIEKSSEYIEHINLSAVSLFELFNNLLIWSKIQTGTLELRSDKIDLNMTITTAYNSYADYSKRKNLKLDNLITPKTFVLMDRNMLLMIMNNLIFNAMKLSKNDTSIKVYSEEINDKVMKVSVENIGLPLKKEELEKVFADHSLRNISNTQNEWSTALGLLLCKELIEKNNGSFSVNSIPGQGNTISFTLIKS